jgi:hypothetical protein
MIATCITRNVFEQLLYLCNDMYQCNKLNKPYQCIKSFPVLRTNTLVSVLQSYYFMQTVEFRPPTKV